MRVRLGKMRLRLRREFDRVFREGLKTSFEVHGRRVDVRFLPAEDRIRFAVIVSRKTARKAVRRNRTKRLVREAFKYALMCAGAEKFPHGDFIFIPRKDLSDLKMQDVLAGICSLLAGMRPLLQNQKRIP